MSEFIKFFKRIFISLAVFILFVIILLGGLTTILNPLFQMMTDPIAAAIRVPGDALREVAMAIPMWMAKGFFLLYYIGVLVWVWMMKKENVVQMLPGREKPFDVRPMVTASMVGMVIITLIL